MKKTSQVTVNEALYQVLADTYATMALTHSAHWNVEGPGFFQLHTAFQTQYEVLFEASDEIAERLRALGSYAVGGLLALGKAAGIAEFTPPLKASDYLEILVEAHDKTVADLLVLRDSAGASGDQETQDLAIGRIQDHQKTLWMLRSCLK